MSLVVGTVALASLLGPAVEELIVIAVTAPVNFSIVTELESSATAPPLLLE